MEALLGKVVTNKAGEKIEVATLKEKNVGLYFSAHWCPPCRNFTPTLKEFYLLMKEKGVKFEIVFVSSDKTEEDWKEYYDTMPWLALPFSDRTRKQKLSEMFGVKGIPTLVILDEEGEVATMDGRKHVEQDTQGANFPWN